MSAKCWYERRDELQEGMVFMTTEGGIVRLDRCVPGDGTQWYVADWDGDTWAYYDSTVEPGELKGEPVRDAGSGVEYAVWLAEYYDEPSRVFPHEHEVVGRFRASSEDRLRRQLEQAGHDPEQCRWELVATA